MNDDRIYLVKTDVAKVMDDPAEVAYSMGHSKLADLMNQPRGDEEPLLIAQMRVAMDGEHDRTANLANAAAVLFMELRDVNWAGFYLLQGNELVLGPFQGKPATSRIAMGKRCLWDGSVNATGGAGR